jgi:hypothetical protein
MRNQDFDLRIFSDLLNTGEIPEQKVRPPDSFGSESSLPSVQWSIAVVYLMKAIFAKAWAVAVPLGDDMVME